MKFSELAWKCANNKNHTVIRVEFDAADIKIASTVADAKVAHINVHTPGGITRPPNVIRNRIIAGKLADAAVAELLSHFVAKSVLPFSVSEYDKSRTDAFQNPDPYDLEISNSGSSICQTIEVRSSFCYRLAPPDKIVQKLSIYGWYTSQNKPIEEPRDWYWQVIYYLRPKDIPQATGPSVGIFEDEIAKGKLTGYIVGGASYELLKTKGAARSDQDNAWYWAISPICEGMDCFDLVAAMLGITRPNSI
jgi:hypothetical protein